MPRKLIRKYMPSEQSLKQNRALGWLGDHLYSPNLWHLTRKSVSLAVGLGLFCAMIPLPAQMIIAAACALIIRCNVAIAIGLVWVTNPLTIPPIFYCNYVVGTFVLGQPEMASEFKFSLEWLHDSIAHIWQPLLLGSVITGVITACIGYILANRLWIWHVNRAWQKRKRKTLDQR